MSTRVPCVSEKLVSTRAEHPTAPRAAEPPPREYPSRAPERLGPIHRFSSRTHPVLNCAFQWEIQPHRGQNLSAMFFYPYGGVELPPPVFPHRGCSLIRRGGTWHATKGTARLRCSPIRPGGTAPVDMETLRVRLFSHPPGRDGVCRHGDAPSAALSPTRPGGTVPVDMETPRVRLYLPSA